MGIQKEREAFEAYFKDKYPELHKDVFDENGDDRAIIGYSFALSAWQAAKAQAVPEGFVLVLKELSDDLADELASDAFNNSKSLFDYEHRDSLAAQKEQLRLRWCRNKAIDYQRNYADMIKAQEPAPLKLGDLVKPIDHRYTLASGCERYPYAYVVNTNPFQLMSEEGDMYWCCTVEAGGYKLIKSNDQLPEAVSLRMIREGLLSPVETQEQSHENV